MNPLQELAVRHGTDKFGLHNYMHVYWKFLAEFRYKPVKVLEIGIGGYESLSEGGASLAVWRDFFPRGMIVGLDLFEKDIGLGPRVTCLRGSQTDDVFMDSVHTDYGPFDIIIDDGSHMNSDVIWTFNHAFPRLAEGGFYFIEDTQTSFFTEFGGSSEQSIDNILGFFSKIFIDIDHNEIKATRYKCITSDHAPSIVSLHRYHNMIIIEKGDNRFPSNFEFGEISSNKLDDILSILTTTRGFQNHNRLGILYDVLFLSGRLDRAASVLQSIKRLPPLPSSYFDRAIQLAKVQDRWRDVEILEEESRKFKKENIR